MCEISEDRAVADCEFVLSFLFYSDARLARLGAEAIPVNCSAVTAACPLLYIVYSAPHRTAATLPPPPTSDIRTLYVRYRLSATYPVH